MQAQLLNLNLLHHTPLKNFPYPYLTVTNFINPDHLAKLAESFPIVKSRGSIPASSVSCQPLFQKLINELEGEPLRQAIANKFTLDLDRKPTMLTLRGQVNERDGHIHTDSKSKLITLLLYMNPNWESDAGKLRVLKNNSSLDDFVEEVSPLAGSCIIFQVTDNCWHGHSLFVGKRLSLQLNYLSSKVALSKHLNHHRLSARIKSWFVTKFKN